MLPALIKAPWYVNGKGLTMEKWHVGFDPREAKSKKIPIWMHIPGLPLHFWDRDIIRGIANAFGQILAIDSATANRTRLINARFCVLVNMDQQIPKTVDLTFNGMDWNLELVPEFDRVKCSKCKQWGHMETMCEEGKKGEGEETQVDHNRGEEISDTKVEILGQEQGQSLTPDGQEEVREEDPSKNEEGGIRIELEGSKEIEEEQRAEREDTGMVEERSETPRSREEGVREDPEEEEDSEVEALGTKTSRRKRRGPDLGGEEKHRGRPSERAKRDKDTAEQVELGYQKTLDGTKGKGKSKR